MRDTRTAEKRKRVLRYQNQFICCGDRTLHARKKLLNKFPSRALGIKLFQDI
jgi:hypothetical protein